MTSMQTTHRRIAAMRFALGLAMQAKLGTPHLNALRLTVVAVDREFPPDDPLRVALHELADRMQGTRLDQSEMQAAGEKLFDAVRRATWPVCSRADLEA
jgi:hypothetical protein